MEPTENMDQDPQRGGSFVRQADGSLEQQEGTAPAAFTAATEPKTAEQAKFDEE